MIFVTAAGLMAFFLPATYISTGKIYINDNQDAMNSILSSIGLDDISGMLLQGGDSDIEDQLQQIVLRPFVKKLAKKLFIMDDQYNFINPDSMLDPGLEEKLKGWPTLEVSTVSDTSMIEITASSTIPREAKYIVDTIAKIFIEYTLAKDTEQYKAAGNFLKTQRRDAEKQYNASLENLRIFQEKNGAMDLSKEIQVAIEHIADLMTQMEENRLETSETNAALKILENKLTTEKKFIVSSETISQNEMVNTLKNRIIDLNIDYESKKIELTDHHPVVRSLKNQIKEAEKQFSSLVKRELQTQVSSQNPLYQMVEELYAKDLVKKSELDIRNELIPKLIKTYEKKLKDFPEKIEKYSRLKLSLTVSEELYNSLLTYEKSIGVAQAMSISRIDLVEPGSIQDLASPESPNKKFIFVVAVFSGLMTGFGLAFLFDYFNNTINSLSDVEGLENLNFLGHVPALRKKDLTKQGVLSEHAFNSPSFETYRSVRNNIQFVLDDRQLKSFFISSVMEGEGKTTTLCNLAIVFARSGLKVLAVDLDLRRPTVHEKFGLDNFKGVSTCLLKKINYTELVQTIHVKAFEFDVLTSGPVPSEPDMLIESTALENLLKEANENYDMVLIDTPPMLMISDAVLIGRTVPQIVWLMDIKKVGRDSASLILKRLEEAGVDITGLIVNNQQARKSDFYNKYYGNYYYSK